MASRKLALPPSLATVEGFRRIVAPATGELNPKRIVVRNVAEVVTVAFPMQDFQLIVKRDGTIVTAHGPVSAMTLELCYPECETEDDIASVEELFREAGLAKGLTPSGRALALAQRMEPHTRQWRVPMLMMDAFQGSYFGGYAWGPTTKPGYRECARCGAQLWEPGIYQADIVSSYPYLAQLPLPTVGAAKMERGWQRGAVLVHVTHAVQFGARLFARHAEGMPHHPTELSGWYVADEVEYLRDTGHLHGVQVDRCITIGMAQPYLRPVVEHLGPFKERETGPRRTAIKVALNGLIGKFAARQSPWRAPRPTDDVRKMGRLELGACTLVHDSALGKLYPRHSNVVWTAVTTARARVRLWQKMDEVRAAGGEVLWCHTDAVIARVPDSYRPHSGTSLGEWRTLVRTTNFPPPPPHHCTTEVHP